MNFNEACAAARKISNELTTRIYVVENNGTIGLIDVADLPEETTPAGTIAYTWYQRRSKDSNKWSIQKVN